MLTTSLSGCNLITLFLFSSLCQVERGSVTGWWPLSWDVRTHIKVQGPLVIQVIFLTSLLPWLLLCLSASLGWILGYLLPAPWNPGPCLTSSCPPGRVALRPALHHCSPAYWSPGRQEGLLASPEESQRWGSSGSCLVLAMQGASAGWWGGASHPHPRHMLSTFLNGGSKPLSVMSSCSGFVRQRPWLDSFNFILHAAPQITQQPLLRAWLMHSNSLNLILALSNNANKYCFLDVYQSVAIALLTADLLSHNCG